VHIDNRTWGIGEIHITGTPELPEETVQQKLGLKTGQKYSFFKMQNQTQKDLLRWISKNVEAA
jgi:hypothetical protein